MASTENTREIAGHLTRIQQLCREYVTQPESQRKMTFASIREAADTIATLGFDGFGESLANDVQAEVNVINGSIDDLSDRFGSDEEGRCHVCATELAEIGVGGGQTMRYCGNCPTEILDAVRAISDLTSAEVL